MSKKYSMLAATVNCSIGDKEQHLDDQQILQIILGKNAVLSPIEKHVIATIKNEALDEEIEAFAAANFITPESIKEKVYGH